MTTAPPTEGARVIDHPKRDVPLSEVVESHRALSVLREAGYITIGDVLDKGFLPLRKMRYVGEGTQNLIARAIGFVPEEVHSEEEIEEGRHPIRMDALSPEFRIALLPTHRHVMPNGVMTLDQPLYIEFSGHDGVLTKEKWLLRIYERDRERVMKGMADPTLKWRRDAVAWLRGHATYQRGEFRILEG